VSWEATSAVIAKSKQKGSALLTMLVMANYSDKYGYLWAGIKALALDTRLSERNIQNLNRRAVKCGELRVFPNQGPVITRSATPGAIGQRTNLYRIALCEEPPIGYSPLPATRGRKDFTTSDERASQRAELGGESQSGKVVQCVAPGESQREKVVQESALGGESQREKVAQSVAPDPSLERPEIRQEEGAALRPNGSAPSATWKGSDEWLRKFLHEQTFLPVEPLDDPLWWDNVTESLEGVDVPFLSREFAGIAAKLIENPSLRSYGAGRWKQYVRNWLTNAKNSKGEKKSWPDTRMQARR